MTNELKRIYEREGKTPRYFDDEVPCELFRGQHPDEYKAQQFLLQPHPGYTRTNQQTGQTVTRLADVKVVERNGEQFVLGCRCTSGEYRGLSTFDKPVSWFKPSWFNFSIAAGTKLPPGLAVTKDGYNRMRNATHYTIAPKDDMPLGLFLQTLKVLADQARFIGK
ncbi:MULTISPECIES: hypothetical protein [unclassified Rhizobacter]|uniref:Tse2 family ADP-ribosyltransferase toxin n=1 Tax=unclassified Rhizobacter TaxID=2640088 RepID=UPI00070005F7|nr:MULTISPECIES: hypothetical protein [unclassified Rhizobacter]KQU75636.1 hypothetical protein ASC88_25070 [Rhizobacter sp. Root29]KQW07423.1 hypothetical protein ASC98_25385 [Rhizobacter sp. Root1238]